jgi:choline/glycine/proline betaine transport protein
VRSDRLLESLPLAQIVSGLAVLIVVIFFTTSSDSASLVIHMLCSSDVTEDPPTRQRVFWALAEGAVAATLLTAGGLTALQDVITVLGLPFFVLGLLIIYCLARSLGQDRPSRRRLEGRPRAPAEHRRDPADELRGPVDDPRRPAEDGRGPVADPRRPADDRRVAAGGVGEQPSTTDGEVAGGRPPADGP